MASILNAIGWLLRCDERVIEDPLGDTFSDRNTRGVALAEGQLLGSFFTSIRILLQAIFSPSSVPLIPALPPSTRKRYVRKSAMDALVKSDKGGKDEDCYICLRPVGTRHLLSLLQEKEVAAAASKSVVSPALSSSSKLFDVDHDDGSDDDAADDGEGDNDRSSSEKGRSSSSSSKQQQQHQRQQRQQEEQTERRRQQQQQQSQRHHHHQQQQQAQQEQREQRRRSKKASSSSPPRLILALPCGHRFCDCCVRRWLASHASCPTCRYQFPERDCEVVKEP